jgi:hypothetical protein
LNRLGQSTKIARSRERRQRPTAGGRCYGIIQHFMAPPRLTVFLQADAAEAAARRAEGTPPA